MNKILIDLPELIETNRLKLQIPKAGFGEGLYKAIMDGFDDYVKWLSWPNVKPTYDSVEQDCRMHHAEFILRDFIRYLIIDKKTNEIIGRCGFPPMQSNWYIPQFGISYFISKSKRNSGYCTEAVRAMTKLAFEKLNAKKVEIFCDSENVASTMIPKKLGFSLEYTTLGGWPRPDNKLAKLQCYTLLSINDLLI